MSGLRNSPVTRIAQVSANVDGKLTALYLPFGRKDEDIPMSALHATGAEAPNLSEGGLQADLAHKCLYYMSLMREVEDRIERKLYRQGKIVGGVYVGRGQEAIPVGSALCALPEDVLLPSHRDMAVFFIRGVSARRVLAQYMGRADGLTRGRDGNMHMGDMGVGIVSIISALAATVPVATGVALAMRYQGKNAVAFSYFGDGATSLGHWHEGVNFATVQKLPVVFICNNNQYAYSTPLHLQMACANVADRGAAYNMPAEIVDGNDVMAVHEATQRAVEHARSGLGPYLLECKTFRMTGHSASDGADYVPKGLFEDWGKLDPIVRLEKRMIEEGWASRNDLDAVAAAVKAEADDAVEWADNSPWPDPASLLDNVYEKE
jgi:TPP-dependent pyruvate/acetoin dehydrogenase alpha subunit